MSTRHETTRQTRTGEAYAGRPATEPRRRGPALARPSAPRRRRSCPPPPGGRLRRAPPCGVGVHRLGPLVLAAAHLDAGRADPALHAVARGDPRLADPAVRDRRDEGADFKDAHTPCSGRVYDKLGLFHVYSSVWFSAIYILLFISLIGCIVPRTWQFVGQLRGRPPGAPKRLNRLPAYATWRTDAEPGAGPRGRPRRCCASAASARTSPGTPSPPRRAICARPATCSSTSR